MYPFSTPIKYAQNENPTAAMEEYGLPATSAVKPYPKAPSSALDSFQKKSKHPLISSSINPFVKLSIFMIKNEPQ